MKARCKPMEIIMAYTQVLISLKLQKMDLSGFAKKLLIYLCHSLPFKIIYCNNHTDYHLKTAWLYCFYRNCSYL